ncbi:hypothetical protein KXD93_26690 [Mucilaginibacter sp. BJC16-A38]|uniref:hypothetical protein n=1 Tax=Mucilaginibacter phenanthrenivorans TaxID=1234842 RepID=UPI002157BB32|nr:hypothetical protein [Mucilaginibacter phenanthrenivorans]MCR8561269.1 hypothetical protein [Mucilaginibacter phenanthrenivorans]
MKRYIILASIGLLISYIKIRDKNNYRYTFNTDRNLYVEVYSTGLVGNLKAEYLTDSTNFRVYLGTFDDERGYIHCAIKGDKVLVEKREHGVEKGPKWDELKTVERKIYSLMELKRRRNFE